MIEIHRQGIGRPIRVYPHHVKAARLLLRRGKGPTEALRMSGYSAGHSRKGMMLFLLCNGLRLAMQREMEGQLNGAL